SLKRLKLATRFLIGKAHLLAVPIHHATGEILELCPLVEVLQQSDLVTLLLLLGPGEQRLPGPGWGAIADARTAAQCWWCGGRRRLSLGRGLRGSRYRHTLLNERRDTVPIEVTGDAELHGRALEGVGIAALVVVAGVSHPGVAAGVRLRESGP